MTLPSPQNHPGRRLRWEFAVLGALLLLPSFIYGRALWGDEIPYSMDTLLYFFPLRWHAASLLHSGHMPWWNRSILGGMPLFSNPQAALAYPLGWPMLAAPSGFTFTGLMTLHLGLWAAATALLLRRLGAPLGIAMWAGAICLAGNYGWSRLQFGNYLFVMPWWPVWLMGAHGFAETGRAKHVVLGAAATALMILAGAHQLAAYGLLGLGIYSAAMIVIDRAARRQWAIYFPATVGLGLLLGAPGWAPQWAFLQETTRIDAIEARAVLSGTFDSWRQIVSALTGPMGAGPADAESSAAIGLVALITAGLAPLGRRRALAVWSAAWAAALATIALTWRPVAEALVQITPVAAVFHDPRRLLGVAHWLLILASGVSLAAWLGWAPAVDEDAPSQPRGDSVGRRAMACLPAAAIALVLAFAIPWSPQSPWTWVWGAAIGLVAAGFLRPTGAPQAATPDADPDADQDSDQGTARPGPRRREVAARRLAAACALAAVAAPAADTWKSTALDTIPFWRLQSLEGRPPLIASAALLPGERFFSLDWKPDTSYDYRREDLIHAALPNLAMIWGLEDIGGYEPARSARYDRWIARATAWPGDRRPWSAYFGLIYPPHPSDSARMAALAEANLAAAILPRWGFPIYQSRLDETRWGGLAPPWPATGRLRAVYLPEASQTGPGGAPGDEAGSVRSVTTYRVTGVPKTRPLGPETSIESDRFAVHEIDLDEGAARTEDRLPPPLARVDLSLRPADLKVGSFLWPDDMTELYVPLEEDVLVKAYRYSGPAEWVRFIDRDPKQDGQGELLSYAIGPNRLELEVRWSGEMPTVLEIHDAYWRGWTATARGEPVEVRPSGPEGDGLWRLLRFPSGVSRVVLTYRPPYLRASLLLCLLGAALSAALIVVSLIRFDRGPGAPNPPVR